MKLVLGDVDEPGMQETPESGQALGCQY